MYDSILIPTDGSDPARGAAAHGMYLAETFDATVHVINVVDVQAAAGPFNAGGVDDGFVEGLEERGEQAIADVEALAGTVPSVETAVVRGTPTEAILSYAEDVAVDLIVMGTHGRSGVSRYVTGSVCEHVVRHADVPVVTLRSQEASGAVDAYENVLIPTDGSDFAEAAVDDGIAVASATGATVHAVSVVDVRALGVSSGSGVDDVRRQLKSQADDATQHVAGRAREASLEVATALMEGAPADALLEYAADNDVDFVAMGTTGRTGLSRFLLGSTAERVIRRAAVPVLSVNAGDRAADR